MRDRTMKTNDAPTDSGGPLLVHDSYDNDTDQVKISGVSKLYVVLMLCLFITGVVSVAVLAVTWFKDTPPPPLVAQPVCTDPCLITLVESIPDNLTYPEKYARHLSTYEGWMNLLNMAEHSIDIASYYWSLKGVDVIPDSSDWQGENIYSELLKAGTERGIDIRIAQSQPTPNEPSNDTIELARAGAAEVRSLDFERFMPSHSGILHTKMWLVDGKHFYVGSANMDWRSLTQVKEVGAVVYNCSCLAQDMGKIFETYWYMGAPDSRLPEQWPSKYNTKYNVTSPMELNFNDTVTHTMIANSPPELCATGRSTDIDTILHIIDSAHSFVSIAVMDYIPAIVFSYPQSYWSVIDDKLRSVAYNKKVHVRVLASVWNHTEPQMLLFLESLAALDGVKPGVHIDVKLFKVPAYTEAQKRKKYRLVNHNKYMITDNAAYIGTSNWSGDYFVNTGGIGLVVNQTSNDAKLQESDTFQKQLLEVFERDWYSEYATKLNVTKM